MKTIFAILAMIVSISCFAEFFNSDKYRELHQKYLDTRNAEDNEVRLKYVTETEFNTALPDYAHVYKIFMTIIYKSKFTDTITEEAIIAEINKLYKLTDKDSIDNIVVQVACYKQAFDALEKKLEKGDMSIENISYGAARFAPYCLSKKDYDKAIKYANLVKPITNSSATILMRAYGAKGDIENAFKAGERLFLETYITSPASAMSVMTNMMNQVPDSYDDAKLAELLAKIGRKYPAPGADFEAWKGFMGFIGYRYKALTGKDLFAKEQ